MFCTSFMSIDATTSFTKLSHFNCVVKSKLYPHTKGDPHFWEDVNHSKNHSVHKIRSLRFPLFRTRNMYSTDGVIRFMYFVFLCLHTSVFRKNYKTIK